MKPLDSFDATTVALQESNLIEASAGTGKTYSIAILVLRLILEKKIAVKEILMVTFTKAAVAELEERIRSFIHKAYKASMGETCNDETIAAIVERCDDQGEARRLLKEAILFLDETSVLTIHSFCQKTLTEFAFETGQMFGSEILQDTGALIEGEVNKLWRSHIATIEKDMLRNLVNSGLSRNGLIAVVREHVSGKRYHLFNPAETYIISYSEELKKELNELLERQEEMTNELVQYVNDHKADIIARAESNKYAKNLLEYIDEPETFIRQVYDRRDKKYATQLFNDIIEKADLREAVKEQRNGRTDDLLNVVNCFALQEITRGLNHYKELNNQLSFDDMIVKLHESLVKRDSGRLVQALQRKFKAVFVDEFQDTDRLQYEVFQKVFSTNTILFYIGDPKQSIYAWRKADIFTYFKAYDAVAQRYGMNRNFRSSEPMIRAMNAFFQPVPDFDTFHFLNEVHAIQYIQVSAPDQNKKGSISKNGREETPITICTGFTKKETIVDAVAAQVADLLTDPTYKLGTTGTQKNMTASDIGILVRTNRQAKDVKSRLANFGIPAVTIADDKILASEEAVYLLYLLEAMLNISRASINKALLSPFTGFSTKDILQLDDERTIELFRKYKTRWDHDGVYTALMDLMADLNVQKVLLADDTESGDRVITNLYHLIEIVHKVQIRKRLSPQELIAWLKRGIEGEQTEGDEYIQRVENDEEAVKIVTIHKSKGLEYPVVLAPFLDLTIDESDNRWCSFRDPATGEYISLLHRDLSPEQETEWKKQQEQEYRRLIYVAVTRAVYKCYIYKNVHGKNRTSSLAMFTDKLTEGRAELINWSDPPPLPTQRINRTADKWQPPAVRNDVPFALAEPNWTRMSYSFLAAKQEHARKAGGNVQEHEYDQFVFQQLAKGERTGNLLHYIFENIHYTQQDKWDHVIGNAIRRFDPGQLHMYEQPLRELVTHILGAHLEIGSTQFTLGDVAYQKRIHEFEFDLPVALFSSHALADLADDQIQLSVKRAGDLEGIMNGKLDLFFEHDGLYYILDWKSNYLGDRLEDYTGTNLLEAMNEGNYHLQYLIYTLALKKYLESRLEHFDYEQHFGGVIYMFVRGTRKGETTGIFTCKPTLEKINKMEGILGVG